MHKEKFIRKVSILQENSLVNDYCKKFLHTLADLETKYDAYEYLMSLLLKYNIDESVYEIYINKDDDLFIIRQTHDETGTVEDYFQLDMMYAYEDCGIEQYVKRKLESHNRANVLVCLDKVMHNLGKVTYTLGLDVFPYSQDDYDRICGIKDELQRIFDRINVNKQYKKPYGHWDW